MNAVQVVTMRNKTEKINQCMDLTKHISIHFENWQGKIETTTYVYNQIYRKILSKARF